MALDPYTGLVATRGMQMFETRTTNRQSNSRIAVQSRVAITSLQVIFPGWYLNGSLAETAPGADITVTASVEYPVDTFTQIQFSASATGTIPNGGYLVSDAVSVAIPDATTFWIRTFLESSSLIISISGFSGATLLQFYEEAASGLTDKTMGGSIAASGRVYAPCAIVGTTTQPSVCIIGDSLAFGTGDTLAAPYGGPYARAFGPLYGYTLLARSGDRVANFVSGHVNRGAMIQYCSHFVCAYGVNDLFAGGRTEAQVLADLKTAAGYATGGQKVYVSTITPWTDSTDGWQTVENQTAEDAADNINRVELNALLRAHPEEFERVWELADVLESSRDSGFWLPAPSSQFYTTDGIHPTSNGYALLEDAVSIEEAAVGGVRGRRRRSWTP